MPLVTEENAQAAFDYLNNAVDAAGMARCNKILTEAKRKSIEAKLMRECNDKTQSEKATYANSHPEYLEACEAEAKAAGIDEWHRHQKSRASAVIEAWRTEQANLRGASKVA